MRRWGVGCEGNEGPEDMDEIIRRGVDAGKKITRKPRVRRGDMCDPRFQIFGLPDCGELASLAGVHVLYGTA